MTSKHRGKYKLYRITLILMFTGYSSFLGYLLFFGFSRSSREERMMNLIPFQTISNYFTHFHSYPFHIWVINLFGNVAAFIPLGMLAPLIFPRSDSYGQIILRFFLSVLAIEMIQWVFKVGSFDVDDLILNVLGGLFGYAILQGLRRWSKMKRIQ